MNYLSLDKLMTQFRLASRELFNHFFHIVNPYENNGWIIAERFATVEEILFQKLVTEPASLPSIRYGDIQADIKVELNSCEFAPTMFNRDVDSGYWDFPLTETNKEAELVFISFFDWNVLDYRDNQYVRVLVQAWPGHSDIVGKHGLIESQYVQFTKR
ncbi:MAG: hypothetical protein ACYC3O_01315 [Burkholderiales bacterium]